jgi:hypothetical protein
LYNTIATRYFQSVSSAMKRTQIKVVVVGRGDRARKQVADLLERAGYQVTTETAPAARSAPRRAARGKVMNLQQLREHVRQTQGDVARRASVSQPQLSRVEGRRDHLVSTVRKYVRALGGDVQVVAEIGPERIVLRDV